MANVNEFYDSVSDDYFRQYQRANLDSPDSYSANYFRLQILVRRIAELGLKSVYEIGVGEGTPLAAMAAMGLRVAGCDISEKMVAAAKENFTKNKLNPDVIAWGDIQDSITIAGQLKDGQFDAVLAAGVLPHISNDRLFLKSLGMVVKPNGKVFIEFRNKLFSLFTFNRLTKEFILDDLLRDVTQTIKDEVAQELDKRLATNLPPLRDKAGDNKPGYDAILARFHNPFELLDLFKENGFSDPKIHWYHYHPAPPMLQKTLQGSFNRAARQLEHEQTWRGWFLCSAGVVEAVKL